jgi:protein ImuB
VGFIQLRLGSLQLSSGISEIEVEIEGRCAMQQQGELFVDRSPRDLQAATRAFARVRAEFGDQSVVKAVLREGHLPEASFEWEPVRSLVPARPRNVRFPPLVRRIYNRPTVFSPSQQRNSEKQLTRHIDDGTVRETLGPYMVAGGWWQREVQREYYFVTTSNGRSLWMYYDRRRLCWYIHGEVE